MNQMTRWARPSIKVCKSQEKLNKKTEKFFVQNQKAFGKYKNTMSEPKYDFYDMNKRMKEETKQENLEQQSDQDDDFI